MKIRSNERRTKYHLTMPVPVKQFRAEQWGMQMGLREGNTNGSSSARLSGSFLFLGGIVFFVFNTIAEAAYPNYGVKSNALSDLGALGAPTELFWNGQLLVVGLLGLLGMYLLFFRSSWSEKIARRRLTGVVFLLPSVGTIIVSLFPENFVLAVHSVGALVTFVFGGIAAIYTYRLTKPPFRYFSAGLGVITLFATGLLGAGSLFGFGLIERMVVYPNLIWALSFGVYLMAQ